MADEERVRAQQSYEQMLIEALMLSDKAAAEHGIGSIFEDLIDSIWSSVPTSKRVKLEVPTPDGYRVAILEYQDACAMQPPENTPRHELTGHPILRERRLRKKAILIDTLAAMKLLYREPQVGKMMEAEDVD